MQLEWNGDEMLLALVSMIQVTRPELLRPAADGFDVDVAPLLAQKDLNEDELLVLRLYGIFSAAADNTNFVLDLSAIERERLARALALVESSRSWPEDAVALSRALAARLK